MASELRPTQIISEFTCRGSNNYAYRVVDTVTGASQTVCKVRGITLHYSGSKLLHFDVIRAMILKGNTGDEPPVINVHNQNKIKRKMKGVGEQILLSPNPKIKIYRISFFKRRRLGDNTSVPFAYK